MIDESMDFPNLWLSLLSSAIMFVDNFSDMIDDDIKDNGNYRFQVVSLFTYCFFTCKRKW